MKTTPELARSIESTLFAADATRRAVEDLCTQARANGFYSVCVNGSRVELACAALEESGIRVVALAGFPLGAGDADAKRYEVEVAVDQGAHEIDFAVNLGRLKDGDRNFVLREMRDIVEAADERPVKAIIESSLLTHEEKILVCELALDSGIKFVATSTDFHSAKATVEDVRLFCEALGDQAGVKAVGGICDWKTVAALVDAGAERIGTIAGAALAPE